jgi:hypothetical protein
LTARDIKLFVDAGYHTVESVAYTYVSMMFAFIATIFPLAVAMLY